MNTDENIRTKKKEICWKKGLKKRRKNYYRNEKAKSMQCRRRKLKKKLRKIYRRGIEMSKKKDNGKRFMQKESRNIVL